jgi:hypothetical protein
MSIYVIGLHNGDCVLCEIPAEVKGTVDHKTKQHRQSLFSVRLEQRPRKHNLNLTLSLPN